MTYKQIETSREIRQWVKVIIPAALGLVYLNAQYPELKDSIKSIFKKKEEK